MGLQDMVAAISVPPWDETPYWTWCDVCGAWKCYLMQEDKAHTIKDVAKQVHTNGYRLFEKQGKKVLVCPRCHEQVIRGNVKYEGKEIQNGVAGDNYGNRNTTVG